MKRVLYYPLIKSLILIGILFAIGHSAFATTVIVPYDDDIIISARAIVRAKVLSIKSALDERDDIIYSYITLQVNEVFKGNIFSSEIVIKEEGGEIAGRGHMLFGAPKFTGGEDVLLYLDTRRDGSLRTHQMFLGKFSIVTDPNTGHKFAVRDGFEGVSTTSMHSHGTRSSSRVTNRLELNAYQEMVRDRLGVNRAASDEFQDRYYRDAPLYEAPLEYDGISSRGDMTPHFTTISSSNPTWFEPDTGDPVVFFINPDGAPTANVIADVEAAMNAWSTVSGNPLRVVNGGATSSCAPSSGENTIIFNGCDGRWSPSGCSGTLALGGLSWTSQTKVVGGVTYRRATRGFVSFNPYAACNFGNSCNVREVATHEIGHALGLGHSQFSAATMFAFAHFDGRCASLHQDDIDGINFLILGPGGGGGALTITTSSPLQAGTQGTFYSQTLAASGGQTPYGWSLVSGSGQLPTGLSLSSGGVISGTPSALGTFNFTVRVTDGASATAQKAFSITISSSGTQFDSQFVTQTVPTSLQPGQSFNVNLKWLNTGTSAWNGSAGFQAGSQNPAGNLTWGGNRVTMPGVLVQPGQQLDLTFTAFAPQTPGTYNFQWQLMQDGISFGQMSTNVVISVQSASPPLTITTTSLANGTQGTFYSQTLAASGGQTPYGWSLASGSNPLPPGLSLSPSSGTISGTPSASGTFNFIAQVTDSALATAQKALSITINAAIPPLTITTTSLANGTQGTFYSQTLAASGGQTPYSWSLAPGSGPLPNGLNISSGGVISGTPSATGTFNFTVRVIDGLGTSAQKALSITINASIPPLTVATSSLPNATQGTFYSQTLAASGGQSPYGWSLASGSSPLPSGLSLSPSGVISGTPSVSGTFSFTVQVTDSALATAQKLLSITINAPIPPLTITTNSLANGTQGTFYSQTLGASGGQTPYNWSLAPGSGPLPNGLNISSGGAISGTPSASGTFNFTVRVTDGLGTSVQKALSITINASIPPLTITTNSLANGTQGTFYSQTLGASGGQTPYSWSLAPGSGPLPTGLSISAGGVISGTPSASGTFNFTVRVTDGLGTSVQKALSITINTSAPPFDSQFVSQTVPTSVQPGQVFNVNLKWLNTGTSAWNGSAGLQLGSQNPAGNLTWGGSMVALPGILIQPGQQLDLTLTVSAPQTPGAYNFQWQLMQNETSFGQMSTNVVVTVQGNAPVINGPSALQAAKGAPFIHQFNATGGSTPYTWSIVSGALPGGVSLNPSTGVLSGTPSVTGTFSFTVKVTDTASRTDQKTVNLTVVAAPLEVTTVSFPAIPIGAFFSAQLTATGGTTPYSWSLANGSLPAGMSLNSVTGVISGVPVISGVFGFTVSVNDSQLNNALKTLAITVTSPPLSIESGVSSQAIMGTPYEFQPTAFGGTPPYTWFVSAGLMPGGLTLNPNTGAITGTPTSSGTFDFSITVRDQRFVTATGTFQIKVLDPATLPEITKVKYKPLGRKLIVIGKRFDPAGKVFVDGVEVTAAFKHLKGDRFVVKKFDLSPGQHEIVVVNPNNQPSQPKILSIN